MAYPSSVICVLYIAVAFLTGGSWGLNCMSVIAPVVAGRIQASGELRAEGYTFPPNEFERVNLTHFRVCMCSVRKCLRKCCPLGQSYLTTEKGCQNTTVPLRLNITVAPNTIETIFFPELSKQYYFVQGNTCTQRQYRLYPDEKEVDTYHILKDGHLSTPHVEGGPSTINYEHFCVDNRNTGDRFAEEMLLVCFVDQPEDDTLYPIGMIISIPFLLATLCVYAFLPELRNLHGKSLMCHVASLTIGYVFLVAVQLLGKNVDRQFCVYAGFLTQFGFIASFFWLNVMSFDIWWTFSGFGGFKQRGRNRLKFMLYSAYAWGGVGILMIVSIALDLSPNVPDYIIKPEIGVYRCWFNTQKATLAFFYGPMAAIMVCNMCLFTATAYKIFVVKQEANKVLQGDDSKKNNEANKQRFFLYLKLFLVMGVNWIMEVISWAVGGPKEIWYITDVCNTLQGLFIFVIFVWKTRTRKLLKTRFSKKLTRDSDATITTAASYKSSRTSSLNMTNMDRKSGANQNSVKSAPPQ